jgi:hypothetical protein
MIRSFSMMTVAAFFLLAGCGSPEMAATDTSTDDSRAALEGVKESLVGSWSSPSCGARRYPRSLQFNGDSTFAARDLVSPCPPDVVCVWSGIVHTRGTYVVEEGTIFLNDKADPSPVIVSFPDELLVDPTTNSPVEQAPNGELCHYQPEEG